jgi:HK97 family phage major capsid protein
MNTTLAELQGKLDGINAKVEAIAAARGIVGAGANAAPQNLGANSDEQRLLRTFHCRDLRELLQVNSCADRFRHISAADKHAVITLKATFDCARFMRQIFGHEAKDQELTTDNGTLPVVRGILDTAFAKNMGLRSLVRAFSSTGVGDGDEWVPTVISANYVEEYELERKLTAAIKEMPMTSSPWEMPVQTDVTRARLIAEGAAMTDANFGTDKIIFGAVKLGEYYFLPEELNEDSAPAILELARRDVVQSQVRAVEDAIINGDTTGTHMDSDVTAASDSRKAWKGLRKLALEASSTVTFAGGAITELGLSNMRKLAGKYGVNPKQLAWVVGPNGYAQMQRLDKVTTLEKFGPQATVLTGALAVFDGIPVIVSEYIREDLNATGVHDGVTVNRTIVHLANLTRWYVGRRRPIRVRVQQDARLEFDRYQLATYDLGRAFDDPGHQRPRLSLPRSRRIGGEARKARPLLRIQEAPRWPFFNSLSSCATERAGRSSPSRSTPPARRRSRSSRTGTRSSQASSSSP